MKLKQLNNPHTPILTCTPNIYWDEMLQNNLSVPGYEDKDFNQITDPEIMYNVIQHAIMMQQFRNRTGSVTTNSGYRPELYNDVVLPAHKYKSSKISDHKFINSGAWDCDNVQPTDANIKKWIEICEHWNVNYSIGKYSWGTHLGWRRNKEPRMWDNR